MLGREVDREFLSDLTALISCTGDVKAVSLLSDSERESQANEEGARWIRYRDAKHLVALKRVEGLDNQPAFLLEIPVSRETVIQGRAVLGYLICFLLLSGVVLVLVILFLIEGNFISRLSRLGSRLTEIGMDGDLSERLEDAGNDEISGLTRDIDSMLLALQRSARELYGSEHRFEELFNNIKSGVAVFRREEDDGFILENINPAGQKMDNLKEDDVQGRDLLSIYPWLEGTDCYHAISKVWDERVSIHLDPQRYEGEKSPRWREFQIYKLPSEKIVVLYDDVTERMEADRALSRKEEELTQSQKMEAIGRLAGGIAHDFNNILTVVNGVSEIVLMTMDKDDPHRQDLEEINRAGERAADLTEQLLAFSRKQIMKPEIIDMNEVVDKIRKMLKRLIGEDIELEISQTGESAVVKADTGQMEQVLMNLAVNSRDAMPEGGKLSIKTTVEELEGDYIAGNVSMEKVHPLSCRYVVIKIADTGHGMDTETLQKICDPFFTTKAEDKGTGLGLSTSYGIVRQSDGYMWFDSRVGEGTTCTICLPSIDVSDIDLEENKEDPELLHGDETILYVEDEDELRDVTRRFLEYAGFEVLVASDGEKALKVESRRTAPIDLLLTDVVMPGMNGPQLREQLHQSRPDLKVVYVTGYSDELLLGNELDESKENLLKKPFNMTELIRRIRQVLDDRTDGK